MARVNSVWTFPWRIANLLLMLVSYVAWKEDLPEYIGRHINELELLCVYLSLMRWGAELSHKHVCVRSDNMTTVSALNKSTSRSVAIMPLVREIVWVCVKYGITVTSRHIPGVENVFADRLPRLDSFDEACEARIILADFTQNVVFCKNHMSLMAFIFLQESWSQASICCPVRPMCSSGTL